MFRKINRVPLFCDKSGVLREKYSKILKKFLESKLRFCAEKTAICPGDII